MSSSQQNQRKASKKKTDDEKNPKKNDSNGISKIDSGNYNSNGTYSNQRSHSRGTLNQQPQPAFKINQNQAQNHMKDMLQQQNINANNIQHQYIDASNYNPFVQQNQNINGFNMQMGAIGASMGAQGAFAFNQQHNGHFMGGGQAPQVHFIAKKQQFIAQISPDQLMNNDKRPYTAQSSLNNLSNSSKRAGNIYGNSMNNQQKNIYNIANAAFTNDSNIYKIQASRTHTNGFNYHPQLLQMGNHKFSNSLYGEEGKPKIGEKEKAQGFGGSNGFGGGYGSDPYTSVINNSLQAQLQQNQKYNKSKPSQNKFQAKEKEQLYDDTIKMKVQINQVKEDNLKLKTKIKILENELSRKEKTIEDFFQHNQIYQQSQSKTQTNSNQNLIPSTQQTQKYQQETFLVMSLKKQIRELKNEVSKRDEELDVLKKNIKNTRIQELEQEVLAYRDECNRQRQILEELLQKGLTHPIYQQNFMERLQQTQNELNQKDQIIKQLTENLNQQMIDKTFQSNTMSENTNTGQTGITSGVTQSISLVGVKSQVNYNIETTQSEVQVSAPSKAQSQNQQYNNNNNNNREKSLEKINGQLSQNEAAKLDFQKEFQKLKKQVREYQKEQIKLKAENIQIKKESQEKQKNETQQNKDIENNLKNLKEKMKDQKNEIKKKDEKILEFEQKIKKMEETLKEKYENQQKLLVQQEEQQNKILKNQPKTQNKQTKQQKQLEEKVEKTDEKSIQVEGVIASTQSTEQNSKLSSAATQTPAIGTIQQTDIDNTLKIEFQLITLVAQREKLSRDDLTNMMLAGEESLKMLIRKPSDQLIFFIKSNLNNEDIILSHIPRFEMPKTEFECQVLREMRIVMRENQEKIIEKTNDELILWNDFEKFYISLENFDYPHREKLLEFIKYFFLDYIHSKDEIYMNYKAFKEHVTVKKPNGPSADKSRNESGLRSRRQSGESAGSYAGSNEDTIKRRYGALGGQDKDSYNEEERMLDVAEQCFMRIADFLHIQQKTVRQVFLKYSQPEQFKDGSILELISPRSFIDGVKDLGFDDVTELEAACLMKVLAKPELENVVILNEFILIMENFGIPSLREEDELENDYVADTDQEEQSQNNQELTKEKNQTSQDILKNEHSDKPELNDALKKFGNDQRKQKNLLSIKFEILDDKGSKIMKKLARFLLERFMHPREFFGPTIKKEIIGKKQNKVEVIKLSDFYLRIKLASIRKKLKENISLNTFLAIDGNKYPGFVQVKKMIKALEVIAEGEQEIMVKEQLEKEKTLIQKSDEKDETDKKDKHDEENQTSKDEKVSQKKPENKQLKNNLDDVLKIGLKGNHKPMGKERGENLHKIGNHHTHQQLNTIEEDIYETQTSHQSQQIKDGEGSDRDNKSKHQLSTSNQLRNSNYNYDYDDSSRRSFQSGQQENNHEQPSIKFNNKLKTKNIDQNDIHINENIDNNRNKSEMVNYSQRQILDQNQITTKNNQKNDKNLKITSSYVQKNKKKNILIQQTDLNGEISDIQCKKDTMNNQSSDMNGMEEESLDEELNNEYDETKEQVENITKEREHPNFDNEIDEYTDESQEDQLKEDTIKTEQIEQMVDEDMKNQNSMID